MLPDRVSNPGPLTYESGALPIALRGPAPPQESHANVDYGRGNTTTPIRKKDRCSYASPVTVCKYSVSGQK